MLTKRQVEKVDILSRELPMFACTGSLAMRFRGLLHGHDPAALGAWIHDAMSCRMILCRNLQQNCVTTPMRCATMQQLPD